MRTSGTVRDGHPRRTSAPDIHSGYPHRTQGFSVTSPRTSLVLGKLPTRRICLSPVSAISTSKVAGLGRDSLLYSGGSASYTSMWPALTGHTILISEQSQHLSLLGFTTQSSYTFEYIDKSILQHIETSQNSIIFIIPAIHIITQYSRRILLVLAPVSPRDKLPACHVFPPGPPPSGRESKREVTQTTWHLILGPNTTIHIPAAL